MLRAAADRLLDLLRVGGREDEDDVSGRILERLEERVRRALREHVDLVEDVHLAPAGGAERGPLVQLTDAVDAVVRRGVELEHVERRAVLDRPARLAHAAGLAVADVRAVQGFREDARGRRLAGAARSAEQVRVRDPVVAHGVAEGPHDVLLAEHFVETLGPVAAVEGLMVRHAGRLPAGFRPASRRGARLPLATRPPCQVAAGSCATAAREPSQGREAAALSGSCCVPQIAWPSPCRWRARDARSEGCESGRIGTPGERVWGNPPWVRIPLPPLSVGDPQPFAQWALCDQPERWRVSKRCRRGRGVSDGQCELEQRSGR